MLVFGKHGLLSSEETHHLKDIKKPVGEKAEMEEGEKLGSEFDVLESEHTGKMQMTGVLVKNSIAFQDGVLKCD